MPSLIATAAIAQASHGRSVTIYSCTCLTHLHINHHCNALASSIEMCLCYVFRIAAKSHPSFAGARGVLAGVGAMAHSRPLDRQVFCGSIPAHFSEGQMMAEMSAYHIHPLGCRLRSNTGSGEVQHMSTMSLHSHVQSAAKLIQCAPIVYPPCLPTMC